MKSKRSKHNRLLQENAIERLAASKDPQPQRIEPGHFIEPHSTRDPIPSELLDAELRNIKDRREVYRNDSLSNQESSPNTIKTTLVGLAFSGGGIRSAAFNLGFLQAAFTSGLIRHIDYLSTVSGGGYIASYYTSLLADNHQPIESNRPAFARMETTVFTPESSKPAIAVERSQHNRNPAERATVSREPIDSEWALRPNTIINDRLQIPTSGCQPESILKMARNGKYLGDANQAPSRYSIGFFCTNLAILSIVGLLCLIIAYCWRSLDSNYVVNYLYYQYPTTIAKALNQLIPERLGLNEDQGNPIRLTESIRPLLPAILLLLLWISCWLLAYHPPLRQKARKIFTFLSLASGMLLFLLTTGAIIGLATLAAIGTPGILFFIGPLFAFILVYLAASIKTRSFDWASLADKVFLLAAASLFIGIVVILATPSQKLSNPLMSASSPTQISDKTRGIAYPLLGLLFTTLLPLLKPSRLLQSGIKPKSIWEQRAFALVSSALLFGVPLALIWLFAHHDFFAQSNSARAKQLELGDVWWLNLKQQLESESSSKDCINRFIKGKLIRNTDPEDPLSMETLQQHWSSIEKRNPNSIDIVSVPVQQNLLAAKKEFTHRINRDVIVSRAFTDLLIETLGLNSDTSSKIRENWLYKTCISHHPDSFAIERKLILASKNHLPDGEFPALNRMMLEALYPDCFLGYAAVGRPNVIDEDQRLRYYWIVAGLALALFAGLLVNFNSTSLHSYYRDHLAGVFIPSDKRTIRLRDCVTTRKGGPYHLLSGTLNQKPSDQRPSKVDKLNLGLTRTESFLFSPLYCGCASKGYETTGTYCDGDLTLADAMSISGAAISPVQVTNWFVVALMIALNVRTGQWLPRPRSASTALKDEERPNFLRRLFGNTIDLNLGPSLFGLGLETLRSKITGKRNLFLITDGGHHENLGLWPLLNRRCRLIIVSDCSEDGTSGFADLLRVLRRVRVENGIRFSAVFPQDSDSEKEDEIASLLEILRAADEPTDKQIQQQAAEGRLLPGFSHSNRHYFVAKITYPEETTGYLVYIKPTLTGDEGADLQGYAAQNRDFPHHPTPDQMYDEDRFESYRQLGEHIGKKLCQELATGLKVSNLWETDSIIGGLSSSESVIKIRQKEALAALLSERDRRKRFIQRIQNVQ